MNPDELDSDIQKLPEVFEVGSGSQKATVNLTGARSFIKNIIQVTILNKAGEDKELEKDLANARSEILNALAAARTSGNLTPFKILFKNKESSVSPIVERWREIRKELRK